MTTLLECIESARKKYGRGKEGEVDLPLYPINVMIIKAGVKAWLEQTQPVHLQDELTGKYDFYFNKKELLADLKPTEASI